MSSISSPSSDNSEQTSGLLLEGQTNLNDQIPTFIDLLPNQLQPYWVFIQNYPLAEAAAIFMVFWFLAFLFKNVAINAFKRLSSHTETELDDGIVAAIKPLVFSVFIWFGAIIATKSAGFVNGTLQYLAPFASTMIVLAVLKASLTISSLVVTTLSRDDARFKMFDVRTEPLIIISSKIILLVIGAYITLLIWGINPVGLLASAGIVGIAVGFAAKDTLANLFSGVFILADRPYKLGDYVNLDGGERGKVTHIGIRSTRILTNDDIEVTIPNGVIGNGKVVNESGGSYHKMRIRLNVQCAYEADLEEVEQVLVKLAIDHPEICSYPEPRVRVRNFGDSGIDLQLMGWIDEPKDRGRITHLLYKQIHQTFKQQEIEIPYPKRDLYVYQQQ